MIPERKEIEKAVRRLSEVVSTDFFYKLPSGVRVNEDIKVLIFIAEAVLAVKLPEKKKILTDRNGCEYINYDGGKDIGFNDAIDQCTLVIARDYIAKQDLPSVNVINQIIRGHFSTVLQKSDIMIAIVEAGNNAAQAIHDLTEGRKDK